jgi:RNA polymerase sigma factor (sigma-70 family)
MSKQWVLTEESFDALLAWLDPDREQAGHNYESIRRRLIKIFSCRGCCESEDLADETINRVARKLNEIQPTFTGDPARYFFGVANKLYMEYTRKSRVPPPSIPIRDTEQIEQEFQCLENCMDQLTPENRKLVVEYYEEEKRAKIDHRKRLAEQLGIAVNALRIRAHRIRASLEECVQKCVHETAA